MGSFSCTPEAPGPASPGSGSEDAVREVIKLSEHAQRVDALAAELEALAETNPPIGEQPVDVASVNAKLAALQQELKRLEAQLAQVDAAADGGAQ